MSEREDTAHWLTQEAFASYINVTAATLRGWRAKGLPRGNPVPEPERRNPATGVMEWSRVTVDQWIARRPGRGARTDIDSIRRSARLTGAEQ
jgi:hypothetical protein